jgi:hypothetical protein
MQLNPFDISPSIIRHYLRANAAGFQNVLDFSVNVGPLGIRPAGGRLIGYRTHVSRKQFSPCLCIKALVIQLSRLLYPAALTYTPFWRIPRGEKFL